MVKISLSKKQNNKNRQNNAKQNKSRNLRKRSKSNEQSRSLKLEGDSQKNHKEITTKNSGKRAPEARGGYGPQNGATSSDS